MNDSLLSVRNLQKRFGDSGQPAVRDVSLSVARGEILALIGPSGCGKSTTLRMIAGLEDTDSGSITLESRDVTRLAPEKRGIGMVFQDYALFPHMTVAGNILFGADSTGPQRLGELLAMVGLADFRDRYPDELSGGQQQRVALARSFAARPKVILLDEPFSNLDPALRVATRREIRRLLKTSGLGVVMVTHDQEEALSFADRVAVMHQGVIHQTGTAHEVYDFPTSPFVASFLGRTNLIDGIADGKSCATALGHITLARPATGRVTLSLRPECLALHPTQCQHSARVVSVEFKGHDSTYWVNWRGMDLQVDAPSLPRLNEGACVALAIKGPAVAMF